MGTKVVDRIISKLTSSARGEAFNPLIWPSLFCTLAFGFGFAVLLPMGVDVGDATLYESMNNVAMGMAIFWGFAALSTILVGVFFLLFNKPPLGKVSGLMGFMLWFFAGIVYLLSGNGLVFWAIAFPNMWFWGWQYLSLAVFNKEDRADTATIEDYDRGEYDDVENPRDSRRARKRNRGRDGQSHGSYDNVDDGRDTSRPLD